MQRTSILVTTLFLFNQATAQFNYPTARKEYFDTTVMGIRIQDSYFWMERKANEAELMEFCKQQGNRPALFLVEWEGGHMGAEGEIFYLLKFALWQTGHPDFQPVN